MNNGYILVVGFLLSGLGFGHSRFKYIPLPKDPKEVPAATNFAPRNDSTGLKTPPCGGVARTSTAKTYKPGQTLKVEWEETINHPGYFIISYSEKNDADFKIIEPHHVDDKDQTVASGGPNHQFFQEITLPNITCTGCTLQLIQVMGLTPDSSKYYSCSDFILSNDPATGPLAPSDPVPAPKPGVKPAKPSGVKIEKSK